MTDTSQGEHTMGLPAGEQRVLDTIENELGITDQQLAAVGAGQMSPHDAMLLQALDQAHPRPREGGTR